MHGRACKQYIFQSYNTATVNALRCDESPSEKEKKKKKCEKEEKRLKGVKFHTFSGRFQVTSW